MKTEPKFNKIKALTNMSKEVHSQESEDFSDELYRRFQG